MKSGVATQSIIIRNFLFKLNQELFSETSILCPNAPQKPQTKNVLFLTEET